MASLWNTFTLLICFQLISTSFSSENVLKKMKIEKLSLFLEPRKLFENYFKMRENEGWSNTTCERDFSSWVGAISKREAWALKSLVFIFIIDNKK